MASSSFARYQATRKLRAAAAAAAAAPAAVATNPLFSWGTPTALIGTGSSCPGAMWHSTATGSRSDSESDEEDLPVGDEVCKHGYLRKQKHGHKRYFVLKLETADAPARLEYYENARKFRHSVRAAAAAAAAAASGAAVPALIPPRRVITLYQCFSVSQRADAKYRHLIALFTQDEYFAMVAENESEQESWYLLLSRLILESKRRRCGTLSAQPDREPAALAAAAAVEPPFYKDVWQVVVKPRGLGHRKELSGVFRLCLTDEEVVFVRLNTEVASVVVQLLSIRRCGHSEQYFFLEVGRSTVIGPGELWMQVDDCVVAQHMHELFLEKMRALCADEYRARCRSYSVNIGAHLLTLLSTRRHLGLLPLEPGGWLRRSRLDQFCHLRALGDGEDEMLVTRRYVTPSEPVPAGRRGRLQLPRARRSRRALSVPASLFRRLPSSPVRAPQREEAPSDRASLSAEASGAGTGNPAEEDGSPSREGQEDSGDDYMPMHSWGSGNGRDSGGGYGSSGQGPSSQSSGAGQCSGGRQGSGGGQGTSGHQGSGGGQGSGGQGAGGNQCSRDGQGAAGGHAAGGGGASGGQGSGGGHGSGGGQGPGDGRGSGSGKDSGRGKGSGSGKGSNGDGDRDRGKSLKKRSYFGKLSQSKPLLPPPPPPPSPPGAGAISAKAKSGGRFRLYFCADRGATKERKEAKELKDGEIPEGAARVPYRARAFDEDEDDPYVPMRPGVAAPLASSSDYMPMAPQNASASQKRHSRSPFEDSRGYMMMFPTTSPPPAPSPPKAGDLNKDDESKDDSDSDYMFMAPGAGAVPKNPPNPQGGAFSRSWNSYFSLPNPFRNSPLGQSDHSSNANEEEGDYIEVIFNPAMTPAVPFADSAIRYDAETGRIYVVDPFSECCMDVALSPSPCSDPPPVARLLQEEEQGRRHPPSRPETLFAAARAAVSAFPTDSLDRDLSASSASAAAPTLAVGRALAAASALAAAPGIGSAAAGFEAAAGVDSARWFQPVAAASASAAAAAAEADADALTGAQNFAGGSNPGAPNPFADLAGADNRAGQAAAAAAAPTPPPRRRRMPRPPERADSDDDNDDDDTYVTMDFARLDNKNFDSTKKGL